MTEDIWISVIAAIPPTLVAFGAWRQALKSATAVTPNGGSTLADGVNRIETKLAELDKKVDNHGERLARAEGFIQSARKRWWVV